MTGLFITFEGPDGSGKTTQINLLAEELTRRGHEVLQTREPGGSRISDQIREILLSPAHTEMTDPAEVLLYAASRAQHVHERILPALQADKIVLCDRYIDASIAYQAHGLGIDLAAIKQINHFASSGLKADRTYMLDLPVEVSFARLKARLKGNQVQGLDRIERRATEYHERVRAAFLQIATDEPERVLQVDAQLTPEAIHEQIIEDCNRLLHDKNLGK